MLAVSLAAALLCACKKEPAKPDDPIEKGPDFPLKWTDEADAYTIVRADVAPRTVDSAMKAVRTAIKEAYGVSPKVQNDLDSAAGLSAEELTAKREILIGLTNRPETEQVQATLSESEFAVRVVGNKLVILGYTDALTVRAAEWFINNVVGKQEILPGDYVYQATYTVPGGKVAEWDETRPTIVKTSFDTEDIVIANIIATDDYGADLTGMTDSTKAIQRALDACAAAGGGTVFLPTGTYLVTSTVTIPEGVTLLGDWQDPEETDGAEPVYGTIILAKPKTVSEDAARDENPLFLLKENSGAVGLTVYYPDQNTTSPRRYGFTFCGSPSSGNPLGLASLKCITLINSYRGIGICPTYATTADAPKHEQMRLDRIRACALEVAIDMDASSEVGYATDIRISPKYWSEAGAGYATGSNVEEYCRSHTLGMRLGQLDDYVLSTVLIEQCETGIRFTKNTSNYAFWGLFYDLNILECDNGILADKTNPDAGMVIARGRIEGSVYALRNDSADGVIKLCDVTLRGDVKGERIMIDKETDLSDDELVYGTHKKPEAILYVADVAGLSRSKKDASAAIQKALDEAGKTGGVVYVPAGIYSLYAPLTVPAGVELRGVSTVNTKDTRRTDLGTVLLSYVEKDATITLNTNAGVSGLRLWYPPFVPSTALEMLEKSGRMKAESIVGIRGDGEGVYVTRVTIVAGFVGVDFTGCDNHHVKELGGMCYLSLVKAGGKNGVIEEVLSNPSYLTRNNMAAATFDPELCDLSRWSYFMGSEGQSEGFAILCGDLERTYCRTISLEDAEGERVFNCFMYAPNTLVYCDNSSVLAQNLTTDFQYAAFVTAVNNSDVRMINTLRSCGGTSVSCDSSSSLAMLNRVANNFVVEPPYYSSTGKDTVVADTDRLPVTGCETLDRTSGVTLNKDAKYVKEGTASWRHHHEGTETDVVFSYRFNATDVSDYMEDGYLHMSIYITDPLHIFWGGYIELTSSGQADVQELSWAFVSHVAQPGWNEIYLPLNYAKLAGGDFNPSSANFIRVYTTYTKKGDTIDYYIDNIYFCK